MALNLHRLLETAAPDGKAAREWCFPYLSPPHPTAPTPDPFLRETRAEVRSQGVTDQDRTGVLLHRSPGSSGGLSLTPRFMGSLGMLLCCLPLEMLKLAAVCWLGLCDSLDPPFQGKNTLKPK